MTAGKQRGFRLVDLLFAGGLVLILIALVLPMLGRTRGPHPRAYCGANLHAIGMAVHIYSNSHNDLIPTFIDGGMACNYVGWDAENSPPSGNNSHGLTRAWFLLVKGDFVGLESFRCDSDPDVTVAAYDTDDLYDFKSFDNGQTPLSYALQCTKLQVDKDNQVTSGVAIGVGDNSGLAIAADRNGLMSLRTSSRKVAEYQFDSSVTFPPASEDDVTEINSPNHGRDGQNVLVLGGSVGWQEDPRCGIDDDCIWTIADDIDPIWGRRSLVGPPRDADDSYLMP